MNVKITSVILIFISLVLCSFLVSCLGFDSIIVQHRILDKNTYASAQTSDFDGPWADLFARIVRGTATSNYVDEKDINFIYNILKDS
ncbi:MAG: hypothetical protein LBT91_02870, partial [Bifidobacteriaceae bacterium]|nr:hypothetical protein [Bifidobacteriaceae bacterium]